ncbi:MAG: hypothetical protein AAGA46_03215 [Cyanobacteria bacterium P01_F01_bin.13]
MSPPWKLKPEYKRIDVPGTTPFDVPLYYGQLAEEAILWQQLNKDKSIVSADATKRYVEKALRLRDVIDDSLTSEQLSKILTLELATELFELLFYGTKGKPEVYEVEGVSVGKKKSTGKRSTGKSKSTTQTTPASKILDVAQSA